MNVVNPLTLQITLTAADPSWNYRVAQSIPWIASPTALKTEGTNYGTHPVGAGPFILQSWVPNSQYTFVRNPHYWEAGHPYLDQLIVKPISDTQQAVNTFKVGGADVIQVYDPMSIAEAQQGGYKLVETATSGGWSLGFNNTKPPFNDLRLRQAIDLAVNRDQFNKTARNGDATFTIATLDPSGSIFYDQTIKSDTYDPTAAQQLIDQIVAQTGKPVQFTLTGYNFGVGKEDGVLLQAQLNQLKDVHVTLTEEDATSLVRDFNSGNFDVYEDFSPRWVVPSTDLVNAFQTKGLFNYVGYSNPTVDAMLHQLSATTNPQDQVPLVHNVEKAVLNDHAVAWYARAVDASVLNNRVHNFQIYYDQQPLLDSVWVTG
jgi:peptide/nickel transport system substrate-binding protein